jgi:hypothetical protein
VRQGRLGLPAVRVSAATLLVGTLLLAGCGSSTPTTSSQALASRSATSATHAKQGAPGVLDSPGAMRAFARYVVCMHAHGVRHVPARTSPVRLLKALEADSATYRAANLACYTTLAAANQAVAGRMPVQGSG